MWLTRRGTLLVGRPTIEGLRVFRDHEREWMMGCIVAIFGMILPRFALLAGWANDQAYWNNVFGSQIWLGLGFLFLPWTTLIYGLVQQNGLSLLNWIFLAGAVLCDLGTWGGGILGNRKTISNYRDA
jgi:hypothetical protein